MVNRLRVYVISSLRAYPSRNKPNHEHLQYLEIAEEYFEAWIHNIKESIKDTFYKDDCEEIYPENHVENH